ncbi:CRINKLY4 related 3 [Euphorbia peplus]|nr:CRINKLY4 related 3 [Euphorbia peplus]
MYLNLILLLTITTSLLFQCTLLNSLGSSSTIAITSTTHTICGITAGEPTQSIQCNKNGQIYAVQPNISFQAISGGNTFFCGLNSGGLSVFCWDTILNFLPRRIYHSENVQLIDLTVGVDHVCAREVNSGVAKCWRGRGGGRNSIFPSPGSGFKFRMLTSGNGFTCGILRNNNTVYCWGYNDVAAAEIRREFSNLTMLSLVAGENHACGVKNNGYLVCKGSNVSGELQVPFSSPFEYSIFTVGSNFSCAVKERNGLITCWGDADKFRVDDNEAVELVVAGMDVMCAVTTNNLSVICRGSGWSNDVRLRKVLPGPCLQSSCTECGLYPDSEALCGGSRDTNICKSCQIELPVAVPLPPRTERASRGRNELSLAFVIVGSVGTFVGFCSVIYCFISFFCRKRHSLVQPSFINATGVAVGGGNADLTNTGTSITTSSLRSYSTRRYSSSRLGRQRSESSCKLADKIQNFCLSELVAATDNFSLANKIGSGSFELLTGKKALFKNDSGDAVSPSPIEVVEYAIPRISAGELHKVLDKRVGSPEIHETEAVELMAYTAMRCVNLEGRERPNVADIVANLERAWTMCEETPASLSPNPFSIPSD